MMSEFAAGDKVRIKSDAPRYAGHTGTVKWVLCHEQLAYAVEITFGKHKVRVVYLAAELELVAARISAPRTVTVIV